MEADKVKTETDLGVPIQGDSISMEIHKVYIPSAFSTGKYEPEEAVRVKTETDVGIPSEGDCVSMETHKVYIRSAFSTENYEPELNIGTVKVERDVDEVGEEDSIDMKTVEVYRPSGVSIKTEYENCTDVQDAVPGLYTGVCQTACDDGVIVADIKVEEDSDVPEEEDPLAITLPATKTEQAVEVSVSGWSLILVSATKCVSECDHKALALRKLQLSLFCNTKEGQKKERKEET